MRKKHPHFFLVFFFIVILQVLGYTVISIPFMVVDGLMPQWYMDIFSWYYWIANSPMWIIRRMLPNIYLGQLTELYFTILNVLIQTSIIYILSKRQKKTKNTSI
jgi:hypothetical protein